METRSIIALIITILLLIPVFIPRENIKMLKDRLLRKGEWATSPIFITISSWIFLIITLYSFYFWLKIPGGQIFPGAYWWEKLIFGCFMGFAFVTCMFDLVTGGYYHGNLIGFREGIDLGTRSSKSRLKLTLLVLEKVKGVMAEIDKKLEKLPKKPVKKGKK